MALVGNMSQLQQDTFISQIYQASGVNSETQFLFLLGLECWACYLLQR